MIFHKKVFNGFFATKQKKNVIAFERYSPKSKLLIVINFSGVEQKVKIRVSENLPLKLVFMSDENINTETCRIYNDEYGNYIELTLSAFSARIYKESKIKKKII